MSTEICEVKAMPCGLYLGTSLARYLAILDIYMSLFFNVARFISTRDIFKRRTAAHGHGDVWNRASEQLCLSRLPQKLNTPAVLKAPKERKSSKKEGGTQGKPSSLPAILYRWEKSRRPYFRNSEQAPAA